MDGYSTGSRSRGDKGEGLRAGGFKVRASVRVVFYMKKMPRINYSKSKFQLQDKS